MRISVNQYKKINNDKELEKSKSKLRIVYNLTMRLRDLSVAELKDVPPSSNTPNSALSIYKRITGKCIACGKTITVELFSDGSIMNGRQLHCSHFYNTDIYPNIEFYEDNTHLSCAKCNSPYGLHGNKEHYQVNLIKKIGQARFEKLILAKNTIRKLNILEIDRMIFEYRDKSKIEAKRLGVKI